MQLIDTHCHIHDLEFFDGESANSTYNQASEQLEALLLIGTSLVDSKRAVEFAHLHPEKCWACVGIHPHEASKLTEAEITEHLAGIAQLASDEKVRAIGECGFDFYYNERSEVLSKQKQLFAGQLEIAKQYNLPLSFHVREAFDDFWPVFDEFTGIRGVLHSFTDRPKHLEKALERGLYIGINGIATFTSHDWQRELFKTIPIESIVVETDTPFLTPHPFRGTINKPENVIYITNFLAELRGEDVTYITKCTTKNARSLFGLS